MNTDYYTDEPIPTDNAKRSSGTANMPDTATSAHRHWDTVPPEERRKDIEDFAAALGYGSKQETPPTAPSSSRPVMSAYTLPPLLEEWMKRMHTLPPGISYAQSLYADAIFLQSLTDKAAIVSYNHYNPGYRSMSTFQLRSYFTFRTACRGGHYPQVPLSYIYLYVYELLMQIGVADAEEGYAALQRVATYYGATHPRLAAHLRLWLQDYVIYNNLREHCAEVFPDTAALQHTLSTLEHPEQYPDADLLAAAELLSTYSVRQSPFGKSHEEITTSVCAKVLRNLHSYYLRSNGQGLCGNLIAPRSRNVYTLFAGAPFWRPNSPRNYSFEVFPHLRYICEEHIWYKESIPIPTFPNLPKNKFLSNLLHDTDRELRLVYGGSSLKRALTSDYYTSLITNAIQEYKKEAYLKAHPPVTVDLTRLNQIRADAAYTQQSLIVEEPVPKTTTPPPTPPAPVVENTATTETPLNEVERQFLSLLLHNGDWNAYLKSCHQIPSVVIEQINEKLYDLYNDVVIEEVDGRPQPVEDYMDSLLKTIR